MSSEPSSLPTSTKSKTKSKEGDDHHLKSCPSDVTINNERMFTSLEELMTYIGSRFPHYRLTILPIFIVYFFVFFISRFIADTKKMSSTESMKNNGTHEFFFSKCLENKGDDLLKVTEKADFMNVDIPNGELTIVMNAVFMFTTTTVSPRSMILCCLGVISVAHFIMAHFSSQIQMSIFVTQIFTELFRVLIAVFIAENVPKFHRMPAIILLELVRTSAQTISTLFVRLPSDIHLPMSYCFEIFGFLAILMGFIVYYTFNDSLYSLLARSKTDQMQNRVAFLFEKSDINLAPDAVIDQIAFENFENNDNPIEILVKTLKTFKLIQEVLVCGLISGACLAVNAFVESETNRHAEVMYFEKALIPDATCTLSNLLLMLLSFLWPKKRILPVILVIPVLFLTTSAIFLVPTYFNEFDRCSQHYIVHKNYFPVYLAIGVLTSALTDSIRFLVKLHLLEVMPVLIRTPIICVLHFVQYSFDGNVRDLYSTDSIGGETILILISIIAMLVFLLTPRKTNDMNVFFSEYSNIDKQRAIPPAPEFM